MKRNTRYEVIKAVRSRIISLDLAPGAPISENELATNLGVSRTPVREALLILGEEHLVEIYPRIGTFVTLIDVQLVRDSHFIRESLELASLDQMTLPLTPESAENIAANLVAQEVAAQQNTAEFFRLDEEFHRLLMEAGGHAHAWHIVNNAKAHLDRARMLGLKKASPPINYYREHLSIFESLNDGKRNDARAMLRKHLSRIFDDIDTVAREHPHFFVADPNSNNSSTDRSANETQRYAYLAPHQRMQVHQARKAGPTNPQS